MENPPGVVPVLHEGRCCGTVECTPVPDQTPTPPVGSRVEDHHMAKALFGHIGGPDPRLLAEVRRLRQRVQELETQLGRLEADNDSLRLGALEHELHERDVEVTKEPALA